MRLTSDAVKKAYAKTGREVSQGFMFLDNKACAIGVLWEAATGNRNFDEAAFCEIYKLDPLYVPAFMRGFDGRPDYKCAVVNCETCSSSAMEMGYRDGVAVAISMTQEANTVDS